MPRTVSALSVNVMVTLLHSVPLETLVREVDDDEIETIVYESTGSVTDSDDDIRVLASK